MYVYKKCNPSSCAHPQIVEAAKTRGERSLTEKQEKVQIEIEKCHRRAEEFAECSDLSLMQQYCKEVAQLQRRLGELHEQIAQINREEELFKWTPSTYPQLDTIHTMLEPYHKLFTTVFRWQKAERKFMDGAFLELNAEDTQAEVGVCEWVQGCTGLAISVAHKNNGRSDTHVL